MWHTQSSVHTGAANAAIIIKINAHVMRGVAGKRSSRGPIISLSLLKVCGRNCNPSFCAGVAMLCLATTPRNLALTESGHFLQWITRCCFCLLELARISCLQKEHWARFPEISQNSQTGSLGLGISKSFQKAIQISKLQRYVKASYKECCINYNILLQTLKAPCVG